MKWTGVGLWLSKWDVIQEFPNSDLISAAKSVALAKLFSLLFSQTPDLQYGGDNADLPYRVDVVARITAK